MSKSSVQQRTLKPLLEVGAAVHSAYWDPDDPTKPRSAAPKPAEKKKLSLNLKNLREGDRIFVSWKSDKDLYKATVKEAFQDKGKPVVRLHYDGKKKTSLDVVPLGKVRGFISDGAPDQSSDSDSDDDYPEWYPGVIAGRRIGSPDDERYGPVVYYDVHFDDGDEITGVPDSFIMSSEEFNLILQEDDPNHEWIGVQNVMDKGSKDKWASEVGWYVASLPGSNGDDGGRGEERTFSLLGDALRAYDAAVIRERGTKTKPQELNLPEDWARFFGDVKSHKERARGDVERECKLANKEGIKEGMERAKEQLENAEEQHDLEMERLRNRLNDEREVAVKDAVDAERRRGREELSQFKKEMRGKVEDKLDALREQCKTEKAEWETKQQTQRVKPNLQVGEEVYSAWWPDRNKEDEASWFLGRVKSYSEIPGDEDGPYGPTRMYTIKYNDDGSELKDVPEHYVFPKEDYLLTVDRPHDFQWKGVRNVLDKKSESEWAQKVGYWVASVMSDDGEGVEEVTFSRLSEALRAYDASIVRRKGDKVRRIDLNVPDEWEWLFATAGVKQPKSSYTEEELQEVVKEAVLKENEAVVRKLEAKHAKEVKLAVEEAVIAAVSKERKLKEAKLAEVKTKNQKGRAKAIEDAVSVAVAEAIQKERKGRESKLKEMRTKYESAKAAAVAQAKEEARRTEENLLEAMDEAVQAASVKARQETLEEARRTQELEKDVVRSLQMEGLRGQFQREKEEALRQLREEMEERHRLEMDALRAKLGQVESRTKDANVDAVDGVDTEEQNEALRQLRREAMENRRRLEMDALRAKPRQESKLADSSKASEEASGIYTCSRCGQPRQSVGHVCPGHVYPMNSEAAKEIYALESGKEGANVEFQWMGHKRPAVSSVNAEEPAKVYNLDVLPGSLAPPKKRPRVGQLDDSSPSDENRSGATVSPTELSAQASDSIVAQAAAVASSLDNSPQAIPGLTEAAYVSQTGKMVPPPLSAVDIGLGTQQRPQNDPSPAAADQSAGETTNEGQCAHRARQTAPEAAERDLNKRTRKYSKKMEEMAHDKEGNGSIFGQTADANNATWVECDQCKKWRRLRGVIDTCQLPTQWYCSMNTTDPDRAQCSAPEEAYGKQAQRLQNMRVYATTSGKWKVELRYNKKNRHLGTHKSIEQAAFVDAFALELTKTTRDLPMVEEQAKENVKMLKTAAAEALSHFSESVGVTELNSGHWEVAFPYRGSQCVIGSFATQEDATVASAIAQGHLAARDKHEPTDTEIKQNIDSAKEAVSNVVPMLCGAETRGTATRETTNEGQCAHQQAVDALLVAAGRGGEIDL